MVHSKELLVICKEEAFASLTPGLNPVLMKMGITVILKGCP